MTIAQNAEYSQEVPLSSQGQARAEAGKQMEPFEKNSSNAYDPVHNPNGIISLALAENTLLHKELADYFERHFHLTYSDFTYGSLRGDLRLREALSWVINAYFHPFENVTPNHLIMGNGLVSLVSHLAGAVANRGDGILVAKPFYYGWDIELPLLHGVVPVGVPVPISDMFTLAEVTYFEKMLQESNKKGIKIKAVFVCNPHNPYGRAYPRDVIIEYSRFCEKHNLHLISDEIYALSTFPSLDIPRPQPFVSALSIDLKAHGVNPSRVHVLYGISKDFNCNGFRIGALITQHNQSLIQSMTAIACLMVVSSPASALWTSLLTDNKSLTHFLTLNKFKLQAAYTHLTAWLKFHNLPYLPSSAGHFLLVDMRPTLSNTRSYGTLLSITDDQDMYEREVTLDRFLFARGVQLRQGSMCHMDNGWFRISFTIERNYLNLALARVEDAMGWERWSELRPRKHIKDEPLKVNIRVSLQPHDGISSLELL
ncbi:Pyridoxal phosphate-dependent transferase [Amanita muscaria]